MGFTGFPAAALDFYDDLELDNTKTFWTANKQVYEEAVRAPMAALTEELAEEFGAAKLFRPYRDVRFARDKTPYKTRQGAFVEQAPHTGWYVEVGAPGVRVSAGCYQFNPERLARLRAAIDDEHRGKRLDRILAGLTSAGWTPNGERLKTSPRGYQADHPRLHLLRFRTVTVTKSYGFEPVIHTAALADRVRADWRSAEELLGWLVDHTA